MGKQTIQLKEANQINVFNFHPKRFVSLKDFQSSQKLNG